VVIKVPMHAKQHAACWSHARQNLRNKLSSPDLTAGVFSTLSDEYVKKFVLRQFELGVHVPGLGLVAVVYPSSATCTDSSDTGTMQRKRNFDTI